MALILLSSAEASASLRMNAGFAGPAKQNSTSAKTLEISRIPNMLHAGGTSVFAGVKQASLWQIAKKVQKCSLQRIMNTACKNQSVNVE